MGSTLTNLIYHVVFSVKAREPMIIQEIREELYQYMGGIIKGEGGVLFQMDLKNTPSLQDWKNCIYHSGG